MEGYRPATYGDGFADVYDDWYGGVGDPEATTTRIAELANGGEVLELGVGTGRLALPIAARGVSVVGLDASSPMLSRFAERARGTHRARAVRADMAELPFAAESFSVVLAAYNVMFNLPDRDGQARCIRDAARVIRPDGAFVVETFVLGTDAEPRGGIDVREVTIDSVVLTASLLEPSTQTIRGQHIEITGDGIRMRPWFLRYLALEELDELASAAGFALERRSSGWHDQPFSDRSESQVSVYRRAPS